MNEDLYCGLFSDSKEFRIFLERYFEQHKTDKYDKWHVRDSLSQAWNAALDVATGINPTREERRERADRIDNMLW